MQDNQQELPFEVLETPEFLGLVQDILGSVERWDEIKWGLDWLLERNPTAGNHLPHHDLWVLKLRSEPPMWVYYRLDLIRRQVLPVDIQIFPF